MNRIPSSPTDDLVAAHFAATSGIPVSFIGLSVQLQNFIGVKCHRFMRRTESFRFRSLLMGVSL